MPAPYVEDPDDEFDFAEDWKEEIGDTSPGSTQMSNDVQGAILVGLVRANKLRSCYRWFLGFAEADTTPPWRLRRENPDYHPEIPQLRAYDVDAKPFVPQANLENPNYEPYFESPFATGFNTALYKWMRVTVRYRNFMYRFREDSEISPFEAEWKRHCFTFTEPQVEALTISGGMSQLKFVESGAAGFPVVGTPFGAPIAIYLSKKLITVKWFHVPWEYLSEDPDVFTPTKLDAVLGKVNLDTFMDRYPPGTLLGMPYSHEPATFPVVPEDANDPLRLVNVTMRFSFFDPLRGAPNPLSATIPLARGHNLMPWGGTGTDATKGGDGKFYYATRDGTPNGDPLIPGEDFSPVFSHVSS